MRLHDFLDYRARQQGEETFAIQGERSITYGEALMEANRLANAFVEDGLGSGDRIGLLSKNSIEYMLFYLAGSKTGVVPVPLNYRLAPREWRYILDDAGVKLVIVSNEFLEGIESIRKELATVERFIVVGGPGTGAWEEFRSWIAGRPTTSPEDNITTGHDLFQLYTSGTTGYPKGAVLTQGAVTTHLLQIGLEHQIRPGERVLIVAPLFHVAAANAAAFPTLHAGGCLYIQTDFKPAEVVRALSEERIGMGVFVPAMIQACLTAVPDAGQRNYDQLRLIHYGASPIAEHTLRRAMEVFRCEFTQGYGMTEMTAAISVLSAADHHRALSGQPELLLSAGRPVVGTEVRIVDSEDRPLPNGTVGEIIARGPQMTRGYWNQPEATAYTLRGGWMHTGDAGLLDDEGYLYIQDRLKDMIVSGGENVYPRMVEEVLYQHPAIADAAVIGVPDERWGETVKAIVILRQGMTATAEEIMEFCRDRLGGFERPRSVDFVDALPRTPSGKVLKRLLREPYWADQPRRVAGV
jgi:acyl-CoA synthetase (AMP-forming)/AMP-acid ligase II